MHRWRMFLGKPSRSCGVVLAALLRMNKLLGLLALLTSASLAPSASGAPPSRSVSVSVDANGFHPSRVTAKTGEKLTLVFVRKSDETCVKKVAFPDLGITEALPLRRAVRISIPTEAARTLGFQCGMGMYKSSVVVQ